MACLWRPFFLQLLVISFQMAYGWPSPPSWPSPSQQNGKWTKFKAFHILSTSYTGPANKDLGNDGCVVGFISYFCFGEKPAYSDYNSEEHVDETVLEVVDVMAYLTQDYLSCCPPYSGANPGSYYRCNTWTTEANDNCHTPNLPWNDGKIKGVGAKAPGGRVGFTKKWMYSFPAEGEGYAWWQGPARRIKMSTLAWYWVSQAGGACQSCQTQGLDIEDPCFGQCINSALSTKDLVGLTEDALGDVQNFPNYGVDAPDVQGIVYSGTGQQGQTSKCLELSAGDSAYGTAIDLWDCNGLVNQAWTWNGDDLNIKLAGHNEPGVCLDLPGGQVYNGNPLWIWGCNGKAEQQWEWDSDTASIRSKLNWDYCIDVPGGDTKNGNQLWLWQCNGGSSQKWELYKGLGVDSASHRSRNATKKTTRAVSWMHNMKKWLAEDAVSNYTRPADSVPWYEKKDYKDWYAAQIPSSLPRPLVPKGWNGYNSTGTLLPKVTTVLV